MVPVSHLSPGEQPIERCKIDETTAVAGGSEAVVPFFGTELNASGRMPPEVGTLAEAPEAVALSPWAA